MTQQHAVAGKRSARQDYPDFTIPVVIGLFFLRIANAYLVTTFFQPDEYWQTLEPAWQLAFGNTSGAWLTWEWRERLRSAIHPVLFASCYEAATSIAQLLSLTPAARAELLVAAPKLLQVPIAAAIDFYTWQLSQVVFGLNTRESVAALLLSVWSPWQWYSSTRTFSNTFEALLTVIALTWWPWQWTVTPDTRSTSSQTQPVARPEIDLGQILNQSSESKDFTKQAAKKQPTGEQSKQEVPAQQYIKLDKSVVALTAAALACVIRPTNVIIWAGIVLSALRRYGSPAKAIELAGKVVLIGTAVLALSISIDVAFYGAFTISQYNFIYFNVVQSLSIFYGRNRLDYYFTEGIPLLLTTALPFGITGFWQALRPGPDRPTLQGYTERQTRFLLAVTVAVTVVIFSCIAHKEVRFIYPLLPILHILAARPLASFFVIFPIDQNKLKVGLLIFGLTINLYIMTYTALIHQRGVIDVTTFLRHEAGSSSASNITVGFLMPCHSTPWRSHLVYSSINAWALTCEPPLGVPREWRDEYLDEADIFYNHPGSWIDSNMVARDSILSTKSFSQPTPEDGRRPWPDYLMFFEHLEPTMNGILDGTRYTEHTRFFNTHWHDDWRRRGDVVVHKLDRS